MIAIRWPLLGLVAAVCACSSPAPKESAPAGDAAAAEAPAEAPPATEERVRPPEMSGIDENADVIARAMCDALRDSKRFSFHADTTMERMLSNGSMVEVPASVQITVRRPDGVRVDRMSVKGHRIVQYDGKQIGVLDVDKRLYAKGDAPPTIDEMIDALEKRFDIVLPLSDLVAEDPYIAFSEEFADDGVLLGVFPYRGKQCDVLAYRNESIDWQIWVARDGPRVPLRLAIRYESEPGIPRFIADLSDWNLSDTTADSEFTFSPPADAKPIEIVKRAAEGPTAAADGEKR
jgi:hypothetical protein